MRKTNFYVDDLLNKCRRDLVKSDVSEQSKKITAMKRYDRIYRRWYKWLVADLARLLSDPSCFYKCFYFDLNFIFSRAPICVSS